MSNPVKRRYTRNYFRELRQRKYPPHQFVSRTHCGVCLRISHAEDMRQWRANKRKGRRLPGFVKVWTSGDKEIVRK